jgi:acyl carrier protein
MNRDEIRNEIQGFLVDITDNESIALTDDTRPDDVPGWDSVNHIKLIFALEERFGISLEVSEMTRPDSVEALISLIQNKG